MALIGRTPTLEGLNDQLFAAAIGLREACNNAAALWDYIEPIGRGGLQGPPWSMDQPTADAYYDAVSNAATVAKVYAGLTTVASLTNFDDLLAPARGGR